ncbi:MAG: aldo/keto reductase [Alphaproteobacteria bacterium]|nr:aldo/keto reductase [Alphaproteobacteria bacterium]
MQYVRLGATGLKVSRLSFGTLGYGDPKWHDWTLDEAASRPFFKAALEKGINFFDTADAYSAGVSETVTGNALKDMAKRDDVVIATKVCRPMGPGPNQKGLSRKHIMESIDASLKRLGTDYIDLYQVHRFDYDTPIEETAEALHDVVKAGKALYIGASSMHAWQFMKALGIQRANGLTQFVSMQPHYNLLYREEEREMLPLCASEGIGVIPWSPLARGFLAGNRKAGDNPKQQGAAKTNAETSRAGTDEFAHMLYYREQDFQVVDTVSSIAKKLGKPNAQVALAWMLSKPVISAPIVGATKPHHLEDAVAALSLKLTPEDIKALEEPYKPKRVMGHT